MTKIFRSFLAIVILLNQTGCATVASGKHQDVMIRSNPTGANVLIDGMMSGTTPMLANLVRKKRHTIKVSKPGYETVTRATTRGFNWWYLGNLILGGIIGLIVDPITGAIYEVKPDAVYVDLEKPNQELEVAIKEADEEIKT